MKKMLRKRLSLMIQLLPDIEGTLEENEQQIEEELELERKAEMLRQEERLRSLKKNFERMRVRKFGKHSNRKGKIWRRHK
ncbi:hypothetical protein AgCh_000458 [Apium graveolens]